MKFFPYGVIGLSSIALGTHQFLLYKSWYAKYGQWHHDMYVKIHKHHIYCFMKDIIEESNPTQEKLKWDTGDWHGIECSTVNIENLGKWMSLCSEVLAKKTTLTEDEKKLKTDIDEMQETARQLLLESNKPLFVKGFLQQFCCGNRSANEVIYSIASIANQHI